MSRDDFYASPLGAAYSAYMERPRPEPRIGRLIWGGDTGPYYESMAAVAEVPDGGTIVDCPCGAGPALRALRPDAGVRYIAADLSPAMLRRARERAEKRGLDGIELVERRPKTCPSRTGSADLFLSYWGLHCFPDPEAAMLEIGAGAEARRAPGRRLLRPGAPSLRQRILLRPGLGDFGPMCTEAELLEWLARAACGSPAADAPASTAARCSTSRRRATRPEGRAEVSRRRRAPRR